MKLYIGVCEKCNRDCFYCSTQKNFTYSILNNSNIEKIIYCAKEVFNIDEVIYSGGEPLLLDNLPQLIYNIGNEFPEVLQVIETNGSEELVIEEIIKKMKGRIKFRISLSAPDGDVLEKITPEGAYSKVRNNIFTIETSGIPIDLHYVLVKTVNSDYHIIKKYIDQYTKSQYIDIYFDEIHCDRINNLSPLEYKNSFEEFDMTMKKLLFHMVGEKDFISEYKNNDGKRVFFKKDRCNYECDICLLETHSIAFTSEGYLRKCSLFNDFQQIQILDMSRENLLKEMYCFKNQYFG